MPPENLLNWPPRSGKRFQGVIYSTARGRIRYGRAGVCEWSLKHCGKSLCKHSAHNVHGLSESKQTKSHLDDEQFLRNDVRSGKLSEDTLRVQNDSQTSAWQTTCTMLTIVVIIGRSMGVRVFREARQWRPEDTLDNPTALNSSLYIASNIAIEGQVELGN